MTFQFEFDPPHSIRRETDRKAPVDPAFLRCRVEFSRTMLKVLFAPGTRYALRLHQKI